MFWSFVIYLISISFLFPPHSVQVFLADAQIRGDSLVYSHFIAMERKHEEVWCLISFGFVTQPYYEISPSLKEFVGLSSFVVTGTL